MALLERSFVFLTDIFCRSTASIDVFDPTQFCHRPSDALAPTALALCFSLVSFYV